MASDCPPSPQQTVCLTACGKHGVPLASLTLRSGTRVFSCSKPISQYFSFFFYLIFSAAAWGHRRWISPHEISAHTWRNADFNPFSSVPLRVSWALPFYFWFLPFTKMFYFLTSFICQPEKFTDKYIKRHLNFKKNRLLWCRLHLCCFNYEWRRTNWMLQLNKKNSEWIFWSCPLLL